ncbi:MAG: tRNA 5-methoxyuridine(34)/uridine 5-oxyacetic acid(34) synthase CmoB [Planctomycetota bacterium]|nr:MAG: tRNA 5-methoxyuridine(34)/uridine 5-oxyacetic acid(34) synthase CmoB [Planctomycetota bacterium]
MSHFDRQGLYDELTSLGRGEWARALQKKTEESLSSERHGKLAEWIQALESLPSIDNASLNAAKNAVAIEGDLPETSKAAMEASLRALHPWRKGPFDFFGVAIDTEWRSCLKWDRLAPHLELRNRMVLDVGCGNGYYGWRMLHSGARLVLGLDPFLLFLMQFEAVRKYAGPNCTHYVLPLTDADLPERLNLFDVTLSMGVLYHRTSPIDHLRSLWESLAPGGQLVLETIVIESSRQEVLVPEDRYAKMRNVWFIPSVPMLQLWLRRCGFKDIQVIDVARTMFEEQRRTDWMTFESLADFLDPNDSMRTIEGYPAPVRAMILARKA